MARPASGRRTIRVASWMDAMLGRDTAPPPIVSAVVAPGSAVPLLSGVSALSIVDETGRIRAPPARTDTTAAIQAIATATSTSTPRARRYNKPAAKAAAAAAAAAAASDAIDKKEMEYRYRMADALRREARILETARTPAPTSGVIGPVTAAAASEIDARIAELRRRADLLDAQNSVKEVKLMERSQATKELRAKKQEQRPLAGAAAAPLNQRNKRKFKVHDTNNAVYSLKVQNVVSKSKVNCDFPIDFLRWTEKAKYVEQRFPAPNVVSYDPLVGITHYASGETGCAGARSELASLWAHLQYAARQALHTNSEMSTSNYGMVNITSSSGHGIKVDLKKLKGIIDVLPGLSATYNRTVIDMVSAKEKVPINSARKGVASNFYPSSKTCIVGFSSIGEFELKKDTVYRVFDDAIRRCEITNPTVASITEVEDDDDEASAAPVFEAAEEEEQHNQPAAKKQRTAL
jgi:TATA-box binding protein (TBP) (component of TFIID and TFIIIB)